MTDYLEQLVREWRDAQKAIDAQVEQVKTRPVLQAERGFAVQRLIDAHNALIAYIDSRPKPVTKEQFDDINKRST